jgi:hypothetical protein
MFRTNLRETDFAPYEQNLKAGHEIWDLFSAS